MTKWEVVLKEWKSLQTKLLKTIQQLKTERFSVLTTPEVNFLTHQLREKKTDLAKFTSREHRITLSREEQAQEEKLMEEVVDLERKLKFQGDITNLNFIDKLSIQTDLSQTKLENRERFYQLKELYHKNDNLNNKLNWLRTLVREGDLTQLQSLVRKGQI